MNRTQLPLLLKQPLHGFKVGLRHEDVYLVCSRIDDTRPIGVAGVDRGKLLWNEWDRTHASIIQSATQAGRVPIPASRPGRSTKNTPSNLKPQAGRG